MTVLGKLDAHGSSDKGKVRGANEDQFLISSMSKTMLVHETTLGLDARTRLFGSSQGHLLLVADGLGGPPAGAEASAIAVEDIALYVLNTMPWFFRLDVSHEDDLQDELRSALFASQEAIRRHAEANPEQRGMATSLTMAYILWPRLYVVHVGSCRCYIHRRLRLEQITKDHTFAQSAIDGGSEGDDQALRRRWSKTLWNTLGGTTRNVSPQVYSATLQLKDTLLLCTDGVHAQVSAPEIERILSRGESARALCRKIVGKARQAGGVDNATAVVARFRASDSPGSPAASIEEEASEIVPMPSPHSR